MAAGLPLLLRLPPCLRQQLLSREPLVQQLLQRRPSNIVCTRTFASHARLQQSQPPPKPRVLKQSSQSGPTSPPAAPVAPSRPPPRSQPGALPPKPPPTPSKSAAPPPKPQAKLPPRPSSSSQFDDAFASRYGNAPSILLYVAPKHRAFRFLSFFTGGIILYGAWNYAQVFLKDEPEKNLYKPWYLKTLGGISVLFMTAFATTIIMGPSKLIKTVSVVQQASTSSLAQAPRILKIEVKRNLPFVKPDMVECRPTDVTIDKAVRTMTGDIPMRRVPATDAQGFTEAYASGETFEEPRQKGMKGALSSLNRGLMNSWPAFKREIRRMCLRENMAYLHITGNGEFKLDLAECLVLDDAKPLTQLFTHDPGARRSILARITALWRR